MFDVPVAVKRQKWPEVCDPIQSCFPETKSYQRLAEYDLWACTGTVHNFELNKQATKQSNHLD